MPFSAAEMTVEQLVAQARAGAARAYGELVRRHERTALGVAFGMLQDAQAAGDVVQEATLKAWRRLPDLAEPACFGAWLCGIVRNLCLDQRRRKSLPTCDLQAATLRPDARSPDPVQAICRRETGDRIAQALAELDELTRCAVVLRYFENLSSKEIAPILELSPAAVDMRLSRARQALKEKLAMEVCE